MKFLSLVVFALVVQLLLPVGALATETPAAKAETAVQPMSPQGEYVQKLGNRVLEVLADPKTTNDVRRKIFNELLAQNFELPTIAKFVLGRYWRLATPEQQKEYLDLFFQLCERIYSDRFNLYSGETFSIQSTRNDGDEGFLVQSTIMRNTGPVGVDWRVKSSPTGFKIHDVIVEGVSMATTQRAEFASVIQRNNGEVEGLLKLLRERVADNKASQKP